MTGIVLDDVKRLRLEPGDVLVLRAAHHLSEAQHTFLRDQMRRAFPDHRTAVLENGMSLEVVSA